HWGSARQEAGVISRAPRRLADLLLFRAGYGIRAVGRAVHACARVHEYARVSLRHAVAGTDQRDMGSNVRAALWVVELPARSDDRHRRDAVVRNRDRSVRAVALGGVGRDVHLRSDEDQGAVTTFVA